VQQRFQSSLFEIKQLVQADLFDSELDAAKELAAKKFTRAAGALAGVVLERHLREIAIKHSLTPRKSKPCISDWNDLLKSSDVIDMANWRFIQHLGDIRNLCDHPKSTDPTPEQAMDLVNGVAKIIKTIH
jgi:hypothetical protein